MLNHFVLHCSDDILTLAFSRGCRAVNNVTTSGVQALLNAPYVCL